MWQYTDVLITLSWWSKVQESSVVTQRVRTSWDCDFALASHSSTDEMSPSCSCFPAVPVTVASALINHGYGILFTDTIVISILCALYLCFFSTSQLSSCHCHRCSISVCCTCQCQWRRIQNRCIIWHSLNGDNCQLIAVAYLTGAILRWSSFCAKFCTA